MIYLDLFWAYFKIGLFTIGGGYAMVPMIIQIVVLDKAWISKEMLTNFIAISESTPGPFAINLATFVGMEMGKTAGLGVFGGFLGAGVTTFAVVLPSIIIIMIVTKLFTKFINSSVVKGVMYGMRPAVVGLILSAVVTILLQLILPNVNLSQLGTSSFDGFDGMSALLFVAFFALYHIKIKGKTIHPVLLIIFSAVVGIVVFGVFKL